MSPEGQMPVCERPTRAYPNGRTGTYAGYTAHVLAKQPTCQPCRDANAAQRRAFNAANPKLARELGKAEYERNRGAYAERNLRSKHGLTVQQYDALLTAQGGGCAICGSTNAGGRWGERFHVDHDHNCCPPQKSCSGCRRALLCSPCNVGVGAFADNPDRLMAAAAYLLGRVDVLGVQH